MQQVYQFWCRNTKDIECDTRHVITAENLIKILAEWYKPPEKRQPIID